MAIARRIEPGVRRRSETEPGGRLSRVDPLGAGRLDSGRSAPRADADCVEEGVCTLIAVKYTLGEITCSDVLLLYCKISVVEAAGVEPASEKAQPEKPTCVA